MPIKSFSEESPLSVETKGCNVPFDYSQRLKQRRQVSLLKVEADTGLAWSQAQW